MATIFKGSEIIDLAVRIEQNGLKFYSTLVETAESEDARDVFQYLADQEKQHELVFRKMLQEVGSYQPSAVFEEDYELYMKELAQSHIFTGDQSVEDLARSARSLNEALQIGIGFEKDSILFFTELINFVPEKQGAIIKRLADEEKKHLVKLTELKQAGRV